MVRSYSLLKKTPAEKPGFFILVVNEGINLLFYIHTKAQLAFSP